MNVFKIVKATTHTCHNPHVFPRSSSNINQDIHGLKGRVY